MPAEGTTSSIEVLRNRSARTLAGLRRAPAPAASRPSQAVL